MLLRALGFALDQEILDIIGDNEYLRNTLEKITRKVLKRPFLKSMNAYVQVNHQQLNLRRTYYILASSMQNAMI